MGGCQGRRKDIEPEPLTLEENMTRLENKFNEMDKNGDGKLDLPEFGAALPKLGLEKWDKAKIQECMKKIGGEKGYIDQREFKSACYMASLRQPDVPIDTILKQVLERMMASGGTGALAAGVKGSKLKKTKGPKERGIVQEDATSRLEAKFMALDRDMDGLLDINEFTAGVMELGLDWPKSKVARIMNKIGTATINFKEFQTVLGAAAKNMPEDSSVNDLLKSALRNLAAKTDLNKSFKDNKVKNMIKKLDKAFDDIDQNKDGSLDIKEFTAALKKLSFEWSDAKAAEVLKAIDLDGNGTIERNEFRRCFYAACLQNPDGDLDTLMKDTLNSMATKGNLGKQFKDLNKNGPIKLKRTNSEERKFNYEDDVQSRIEQKFMMIDIDRDGAINVNELSGALQELGLEYPKRTIELMLADMGGENGEISFLQFRAVLYAACVANPDASMNQVLKTVMNNLANKGRLNSQFNNSQIKIKVARLEHEFKKLDKNGDGSLNLVEFTQACSDWGLALDKKGIKKALRKIDTDNSGTIELKEFKRTFTLAISASPTLSLVEAIKNSLLNMAQHGGLGSDLKKGLKLKRINSDDYKAMEEDSVSKIASKFTEIDKNQDGAIDLQEFKTAVKELGLDWDDAKTESVLRKIDTDGSGDISLNEFGQVLYAALDAFPNKPVEDILRSSLTNYAEKSSMHVQFRKVKQEKMMKAVETKFKKLDTNNDGTLDKKEFAAGCKELGLNLEEKEVENLVSAIAGEATEDNKEPSISLPAFKSALYMAVMRNSDTGIDEVLRSVITSLASRSGMNRGLLKNFPKLKKTKGPKMAPTITDEDAMSKIEQAFAMADLNKDGTLSASELITTAKTLGVPFTEDECKDFIATIDLDGSGELTIFDFSHVVSAAATKNPKSKAEDVLKDAFNSLKRQRALKAQMRQRGLKQKMTKISKMFDDLDDNKDGKLDLKEFTKAVKGFGLEWSDADIKDCLDKIDADKNGTIERNEFNSCFYAACMKNPDLALDEIVQTSLLQMMNKGQMSQQFSANFSKLNLKKTKTKVTKLPMEDDGLSLIEAKFMSMDKNLDGGIDAKEFKEAITALGMKVTDAAGFFKKIDKDNDGKINFTKEFKPLLYNCALKNPGWSVDEVFKYVVANA